MFVFRSDKFQTLLSLFLFVPTLSILKQSRKIELTRILFRMSLSSETNAVTFCLSSRSRLRVSLRESFSVSESRIFGDCLSESRANRHEILATNFEAAVDLSRQIRRDGTVK